MRNGLATYTAPAPACATSAGTRNATGRIAEHDLAVTYGNDILEGIVETDAEDETVPSTWELGTVGVRV